MQLVTQIFEEASSDTDTLTLSLRQDESPTLSSNGNPLWSSKFEEEILEISHETDPSLSLTSTLPSALLSFETSASSREYTAPSSTVTAENKQPEAQCTNSRLFYINKPLLILTRADQGAINPRSLLLDGCTDFSILQKREAPASPNLARVINAITDGQPLEALFYVLEDFGLCPNLKGEKASIIGFEHTVPLGSSLRVVGQSSKSEDTMDEHDAFAPSHGSRCHRIYLATDSSFDQYIINDINSLIVVLDKIIQIRRDLESNASVLRPKPKTDAELFEILKTENDPPLPRFSEAEYEVENYCVLDACVSLLSPFGLRPHVSAGQCVRFGHLSFDFEDYGIEIVRFDRFLSTEKKSALQGPFRSGVIVTGLRAKTQEQREADKIRRVRQSAYASGCMEEFNEGKFADKFGLVFSLHLERDWEDLVRRLLVHRDERVCERKRSTDKWRWGNHWLGKQGPGSVKSNDEMQELRKKVGKQAAGKPSPLRMCVNVSDASLERDWFQIFQTV